jgi:hypothetical protein
MKAGDRVMVYDSPGFPMDHYLYATVLTPSDAGALVHIDHPGNLSHGQQKFVGLKRIMTADDVKAKAEQIRQQAAAERDADKRKTLMEHAKGHEFMATQLD